MHVHVHFSNFSYIKKVIKNHSAMTLEKFIEKHLFCPQSDSIECKYFIKCRQSEQFSRNDDRWTMKFIFNNYSLKMNPINNF